MCVPACLVVNVTLKYHIAELMETFFYIVSLMSMSALIHFCNIQLFFDGYNKKFGKDGIHEPMEWDEYQVCKVL